jgi:predicted lipoprotein
MKKNFLVISIFSLLFISCEKEEPQVKNHKTFVKSVFLNEVYDSLIEPLHTEFVNQSLTLQTHANQYNSNATIGNFTLIQNGFDTLIRLKNISSLFNNQTIKNTYLHARIGTTPPDTTFILDKINTQNTLTQSEIDLHSGTRKGLGAIDYLTYGDNMYDRFQLNTAFTNHLIAYSNDIHESVNTLNQTWISEEDNYKSATETSVAGSYNYLINNIINSLEIIKFNKLITPMNGPNGTGATSQYTETAYSLKNMSIIRAELSMIKSIYNGKNGNITGIKDHLLDLEANTVASSIETKLDEAIDLSHNKEHLSFDEMLQNEETSILQLIDMISDLIIYFKVDVASLTSIVVTPGDVDGD